MSDETLKTGTTEDGSSGPSNPATPTTPPKAGTVDADVKAILEGIEAIKLKIAPYRVNISEKDFKRLYKVGNGREPYIDEGAPQAIDHPVYLPGTAKPEAVDANFTLWKGFDQVANELAEMQNEVHKTRLTAGNTLYNEISAFEQIAADAGKRGDATASEIAKNLKTKRPKNHGKKEEIIEVIDEGTQTDDSERPEPPESGPNGGKVDTGV
jgi:hypothetical protein